MQITDPQTNVAILLDLLSALEVAAKINLHAARVLEESARRVEGGLIPEEELDPRDPRWQQDMWRRGDGQVNPEV